MRLAILLIHICAGIVGLLSGIAAVSFRKGSARHGTAGNIFFVSMVIMAVTAALLGNVFAGAMTIYLVTTGWLTGRRRAGETTIFDWGALLFGLAIGLPILIDCVRMASGLNPPKPGPPVGMIVFLGVVMLAVAGDIRMLVRGGVFGKQRVARHLWRMLFGLFIANVSFLAQKRVVAFVGGPKLFLVLAPVPLILIIFWLIRIRFKNVYKRKSVPSGDVHLLPT